MSRDRTGSRWVSDRERTGLGIATPRVDAFLAEVVEVCKRHGFSIGHEDGHGSFVVSEFNHGDAEWLTDASVDGSSLRDDQL